MNILLKYFFVFLCAKVPQTAVNKGSPAFELIEFDCIDKGLNSNYNVYKHKKCCILEGAL